ncbi:DUF3825 domain-containing protein [Mesotoga sp. B105.6.4]|jgi:hypothetical protein|uniref:DUF3825 domain-containing protein n=1 Tax=Mesotoga infera TaxID=1236046 RepID=A0A3D3TMG0_9BACT|nr:DUF3825 domain-containing protein [Mesotoga sp. B105.6.4]HCO69899.1 DUF3825 domain-containing protein [Mesotoga infera]
MRLSGSEIGKFAYFGDPEKSLEMLKHLAGVPSRDIDSLFEEVEEQFRECSARSEIVYFDIDGIPCAQGDDFSWSSEPACCYALFPVKIAGSKATLFGVFSENEKYSIAQKTQKWYGLFWFDTTHLNHAFYEKTSKTYLGDIVFGSRNKLEEFLDRILEIAMPEDWDFYHEYFRHSILKSYIENTYYRAKSEEKIVSNKNEGLSAFNTGLLANRFDVSSIGSGVSEIYIIARIMDKQFIYPRYERPEVCISRVEYDQLFSRVPEIPSFFERIEDVLFNPDRDVHSDAKGMLHIIGDNRDRFPQKLQEESDHQLRQLLMAAIERTKMLAKRNYKLVVPQFYSGKIQFLMPIFLSGDLSRDPDFALVLNPLRSSDSDKVNSYEATTIITLDMAYKNARLIAKPDNTWLKPSSIVESEENTFSGDTLIDG